MIDPKTPASSGDAADWDGSWEENERQRLLLALEATPEQRLAWLEQAIEFAWKAGALPRNDAG